MSRLGQRVSDLAYATGWGVLRGIPEPLAHGSFRMAADLAARRDGPRARQLRKNLARVVPKAGPTELDQLVRDGMRSYARYWAETFRLPTMDHQRIVEKLDEAFVGRPLIDAALDRGKGVVFALAHTGNFDISGLWMVNRYGSFTTVVERLRPESLYQRFFAYRRSLGFEVLATGGDADVAPYRALIDRLRGNGIVCLPADRDLSRRGVPVTFFGAEARMPAGPARLAAMTGAELLIVDNAFTDDGWAVRVHTPMLVHGREEVAAVTQRMADAFAADIAANPVDWHMLQPLWTEDLPEAARAELTGAKAEGAEEAREAR